MGSSSASARTKAKRAGLADTRGVHRLIYAIRGVDVRDGYLRRSARLPRLRDSERFLTWLERQGQTLIQSNNRGAPHMARIYFYKMTTDDGGAPHVKDDVLSLAICKPMIRRTAQPGDVIMGFAASVMDPNNRLIYVARVGERLRGHDYYTAKYVTRGDCIYERRGERFERRDDALYHKEPGDLRHDLGEEPTYPKASVLLCREFAYFGASGNDAYKVACPSIGRALHKLGRGHRVEHAAELRSDLERLASDVLSAMPRVRGKPTSGPGCGVCRRDEDDEVCVADDDGVQTHC